MQGVWGQIHPKTPGQQAGTHEVSGVQAAGPKAHFQFQFARQVKAVIHLGGKGGGFHRLETGGPRRVRAPINFAERLEGYLV